MIRVKKCSACGKEKPLDNFFAAKASRDGKTASCKECILARQKIYYQKNRKKIKEKSKIYANNNKEKIKKRRREHYQKNRKIILKSVKEYAKNNKEKIKRYYKKYSQKPENKKKHNEATCRYIRKNRKTINEKRRAKWKSDPKYRLRNLVSCRMRLSLKSGKNGRSWESLVGYTAYDLEKNLKRKIPKGYTWKDFLDGRLHIDHKIPVAAFNFNSFEDTDFKRCWELKNLQLLPAKTNIRKGAKIEKPFQPSLAGI